MYGIPAQIAYNGGDLGVAYEYNFAYDDAGNRTQWQVVGGTITNYTYDAANKMLTAGNSTFTYDDKGNTLTETNGGITTTYTWDYLNRLTEWQKTGETTQAYVYNADGMRVRVTPSGGTATSFLLDGSEVAEEISSSQLTSYVGSGLVSKIVGQNSEVYYSDGLGSTRAMGDDNESVVRSTIYDSFGNVVQGYPNDDASGFGYIGQGRYYTDATGLCYVKARYYSPATGRFISADPLYYSGGGLNLYAYVDNDPGNYIDPLGLYKHKPGGPYHPPGKVKCTSADDVCSINDKIKEIEKTIASHEEWEKKQPGRHEKEIEDWKRALERCKELKKKKERPVPVPVPVPVPEPAPKPDYCKIGVGVGIGVIIIGIIVAPEVTIPAMCCAAAL